MAEHAIAVEDASKDLAICAAYIVEGITNAEAKSEATASVVGYFLENDDVDSAAEQADALEDPFARDQLLLAAIAKCVDLKDDEYAFQLADAVSEPGLRASAIEIAALRLAERGDFELAYETARKLEHSADTIAGVAVTQAEKGYKEDAEAALEGIDYFRSRVMASTRIAAFHASKNETGDAQYWIEKGASNIEEVEFEEDRIRAYIEIANVCLETGDNEAAATHFNKAVALSSQLDNIHRDSFLVSSAIGLLKAGDVESADKTLDIVEDKTQVAACLYGFSRVYESDEPEDAVETIEEAFAMLKSQSEYEIRSTKSRNEMFAAVAIQFQRLGLDQRALEIAHSNTDETQRNQALTSIAQLLVMDGKEAEADEVIKGIEPESERVYAAIGLSDAANTAKNKDLAIGYLKSAADLLEEVEQMIARAEIADQIALRLDAYGANEDAIAIARGNLALIAEIRNKGGQAVALVSMAAVYKKLGLEPDADDESNLLTMVRRVDW